MKTFKNIILFILNPFRTFGLGKSSDKVTSFFTKREYLIYILSFLVTVLVIFLVYFN